MMGLHARTPAMGQRIGILQKNDLDGPHSDHALKRRYNVNLGHWCHGTRSHWIGFPFSLNDSNIYFSILFGSNRQQASTIHQQCPATNADQKNCVLHPLRSGDGKCRVKGFFCERRVDPGESWGCSDALRRLSRG